MGRGSNKCTLRMHVNFSDHQCNINCYIHRISCKNLMAMTNQKLTIHKKRTTREHNHNTKESHKTQKKRGRKDHRRAKKITRNHLTKWQ